ncbi:hypothetical protein [Pseudomonas aeruginosa]
MAIGSSAPVMSMDYAANMLKSTIVIPSQLPEKTMKRTLKSSWSIERCMQLMVHRGDSLRPELVTLRAHSSLGPLQQHLGQELVFLTGVVSRKPRNFRQPINMACLALGR